MQKGQLADKGKKLASYILDAFKDRKGEDWWLDSTLAEAELLLDKFESSKKSFELALKKHNPPIFEKISTSSQIELYAKLEKKEKQVAHILNMLSLTTKYPVRKL